MNKETEIVEKTETTTDELVDSPLFNDSKNQFRLTGPLENSESLLLQKLGFSTANIHSKSTNGTFKLWNT